MSDRELLEKAAKAAEIPGRWDEKDDGWFVPRVGGGWASLIRWDPLESNSQAFELMVKLGIDVTFDDIEVYAFPPDGIGGLCEMVKENNDPYAATRRAIVRAAAALGEKE